MTNAEFDTLSIGDVVSPHGGKYKGKHMIVTAIDIHEEPCFRKPIVFVFAKLPHEVDSEIPYGTKEYREKCRKYHNAELGSPRFFSLIRHFYEEEKV